MLRAESLAGRLVAALAGRPPATTVSAPVALATQWAAALAARPIVGVRSTARSAASASHTSNATGTDVGTAHGLIVQEPFATDLTAKVNTAWTEFRRSLAEAIQTLPPGAEIELVLDPAAGPSSRTRYVVRVSVEASGSLRATAVGNAMLPAVYRLDRTAVGRLVRLGWSPTSAVAESGDFFSLRLPATAADRLAMIVSQTMRTVYGTPHPAFLTYTVEGSTRSSLTWATPHPPAVLAAAPNDASDDLLALPDWRANLSGVELTVRVANAVADMLNTVPKALQVDGDGDIGIRAGTAMIYIRVRDDPLRVEVSSPVITEIEPTERLHTLLSELTNRMPIGRLFHATDTIWMSVTVFGSDFRPTHLRLAIEAIAGAIDELGGRLRAELGGERFFDPPHTDATQPQPAPGGVPDPPANHEPTEPSQPASRGFIGDTPYYRQPGILITRESFMVAGRRYPVLDLTRLRTVRGFRNQLSIRTVAVSATVLMGIGVTLGMTTELNHLSAQTYLALTALAFVPVLLVAAGRRLRPGSYELWGEFRGLTVLLFSTDDERQYGEVTRALLRAREVALLIRQSAAPFDADLGLHLPSVKPGERSG